MAEDIDKLIDWALANGWEVRRDSKGYRRFFTPHGDYVASYPATPSNPRRRLREVVRTVHREGLSWPPPSKKELRAARRKDRWS